MKQLRCLKLSTSLSIVKRYEINLCKFSPPPPLMVRHGDRYLLECPQRWPPRSSRWWPGCPPTPARSPVRPCRLDAHWSASVRVITEYTCTGFLFHSGKKFRLLDSTLYMGETERILDWLWCVSDRRGLNTVQLSKKCLQKLLCVENF